MNKNLLVGLCAVGIVLALAYVFTQPKEVAAPVKTDVTAETPNTSGSEVTSELQGDASAAGNTQLAGEVLPDTAVITYDGTKFIPETVTIIEGSTVTFRNESDQKMWIGSNNHPTHTLYPVKSDSDCLGSSFDECAAVLKGGEWSFTFSEVGTWNYHNHAKARDGGTVIVQTETEYLSTH